MLRLFVNLSRYRHLAFFLLCKLISTHGVLKRRLHPCKGTVGTAFGQSKARQNCDAGHNRP